MTFVLAAGKRCAILSVLVLLASFGASAQTPELQTYSAEFTVPLTALGAYPTPPIPSNVLQAIQGGALEIRHSVTYTQSQRHLSVRTFLMPPGSPNPTPPAMQTMMYEAYGVNVDAITWYPTTALPPGSSGGSVVITGRVTAGGVSIRPDIFNRLFVHSVGFTNATPTPLNNMLTLIAGSHMLYAQQGTGNLTAGGGTGPGPGPGTGPTVVVTAGQNSTTALPEIELDASGSTGTGTLTYMWRSIGPSASVIGNTSAKPRVQFGQGFNDYVFEVTVTDSTGSATGQVTVRYVGR
jgi:hypothetical protein